jgi:hypothetical protein
MSPKEKVKEIKKAVKSGVAKRRIDVQGNGVNVRKVLKGEKVSEECIEQMYANLLECRENPRASKARRERYSNLHPEVPPKEKVKAISKAVETGIKKTDLDPFGGGDAVRKVLRGQAVGCAKINEMYANWLSLKEEAGQTVPEKKTKGRKRRVPKSGQVQSSKKRQAKDKASSGNARVELPSSGDEHIRILEQNEQIASLQEKVRILEEKVAELSVAVNPRTPLKVLGLTVTQKLDIVKGRKYRRWYAIYRENGTRRWIYIGKDLKKAEEKIQSWREKKGGQQ